MGMVDFEALTRRRRDRAARADRRAPRAHRLAGRRAGARRVGASCSRGRFVKVMPRDYKRVLAELAQAAQGKPRSRWPRSDGRARRFPADRAPRRPLPRPARAGTRLQRVHGRAPGAELRDQGARCMDCGVPFCHNGCPLGNLIPDWNDLVYRDRWQAAIAQLHATNNFPDFTGRLCPAPCEAACVLEIREGDAVTIKQIEHAIIDRAFAEGWVRAGAAAARDRAHASRSSAPGPAGMAAAQQLRRAGPQRDAVRARRGRRRPGALRRAGLQDREDRRRAPRAPARRRGGASCAAASTSAATSACEELRESFDAVVLATGSRVPRDLPVEGRELRRRALRDGLPLPAQPLGREHADPPISPARAALTGTGDLRGGQARRRDRRRRHRRGLRRQRAARGRRVDRAAGAAA